MIVLVTDFGTVDPYVGQMHAAIRSRVDTPVIDLLHDMPAYDVRRSAYLLDALQCGFPGGTVFACVVDPGVGGDRAPVMVKADEKWYVGPDNGLFNIVERRARSVETFHIDWRPEHLSMSFHGRDLFAPVAADLAIGTLPECTPRRLMETPAWPEELPEIIYIDHYGNAMTGIRADALGARSIVRVRDHRLERGTTFSASPAGKPFWYRNSLDLVEIALREDSAAERLELEIGDRVQVTDYESLLGGGA